MVSKAARRYAKAWIQIAIERNELDSILSDVLLIRNTLEASKDLVLFMRSPIIDPGDKKAVLVDLFSDKTDEITQGFLQFLVGKGRGDILEMITESFLSYYNDHIGRVEVDVHSAFPLSEDQKKKLITALESVTGKSVKPVYEENPDLLGGLSVRIGDTVIDGTVSNKIGQLKARFADTAT